MNEASGTTMRTRAGGGSNIAILSEESTTGAAGAAATADRNNRRDTEVSVIYLLLNRLPRLTRCREGRQWNVRPQAPFTAEALRHGENAERKTKQHQSDVLRAILRVSVAPR